MHGFRCGEPVVAISTNSPLDPGSSLLPFFVRRSYRFCCLSSAGRTGSSFLRSFRRSYRFLLAAVLRPPVVPVLLPFFRRSCRFLPAVVLRSPVVPVLLPFFRRSYRFLLAAFLPPVVPVPPCCRSSSAGHTGSSLLPFFRRSYRFSLAAFAN